MEPDIYNKRCKDTIASYTSNAHLNIFPEVPIIPQGRQSERLPPLWIPALASTDRGKQEMTTQVFLANHFHFSLEPIFPFSPPHG